MQEKLARQRQQNKSVTNFAIVVVVLVDCGVSLLVERARHLAQKVGEGESGAPLLSRAEKRR